MAYSFPRHQTRLPRKAAVGRASRVSVPGWSRFSLTVFCVAGLGAMFVARLGYSCTGTVYLTLDTGGMHHAEHIADVMNRYGVRATFFMANEPTFRGDRALDPSWGTFWGARVAEGHAFGSHTWRHWYLRGDLPDGRIKYVSANGRVEALDQEGFCAELNHTAEAFRDLTGRGLDPVWRAPGGRTTPRALEWAVGCGYSHHVGWSAAGYLGDDLPSRQYSNDRLLGRALDTVRDGDILLMHLGIYSRDQPFAAVFEPLIAGLKARGLCFATLAGDR